MIQIEEKEIVKGIDEAYKKAGSNAYFGNGFQAGVDFALKRVENLNIHSVSQRSELLLSAICQFTNRNTQKEIQEVEKWIETDYIK